MDSGKILFMDKLLLILRYIAVTASAVSGALEARKHEMDIVGATTIAFVTAGCGHGHLRRRTARPDVQPHPERLPSKHGTLRHMLLHRHMDLHHPHLAQCQRDHRIRHRRSYHLYFAPARHSI